MRICAFMVLVALALAGAGATASNMAISIDGIDGLVRVDTALAGSTVGFRIRYTNTSDSGFNSTNAFVIYSPEGATWTDSAAGNFKGANLGPIGIDTTGLLSKAQFPTVYALRTFSSPTPSPVMRADGLSPDTVAFSGAGSEPGQGLPPHRDVHAFTFKVKTKVADTNKTICLDSTMRFPSTNRWKWAVLYGGPVPDTVIPTWGGARCVRLVAKIWDPITWSNCTATMSSNHCNTRSYNYNVNVPGGSEADVRYSLIGGPGTIDSFTGVWTGGLLAPGTYALQVRATNFHNGYHIDCNSNVISSNVRPQYSGAGYSADASVGVLATITPSVTGGDCDALAFSLLSSDGAVGPVSINPTTGQLSFTPTSADSARSPLIAMKVMVSDPYSSDTATVTWRFVRACVGTTGNVDCDPDESVDIMDLTALIDYLFVSFKEPCSRSEANINAAGIIDISDLSYLIGHLFFAFQPLPPCP